jgi:cyclopropane fatty-acyl-phospholipid synthase-like methyltransferase
MIGEQLKSSGTVTTPYASDKVQPDRNKAYEERIRKFYDIVSTRPLLTKTTHYMNMGFWKDGARSLDDACEAMARFMGDFGQFCRDDRVLDAGCGFGDQDIYWAMQYRPRSITGVNISEIQVDYARRKIKELDLDDQITIHLASATDLPFPNESFDKVVALESAQHFGTREDFFREAYRVLRPGGHIYMADIIPMPATVISNLAVKVMSLNKDNLYARDTYEQILRNAGFARTAVTSIRDSVLIPFKRYMDQTAANAPLMERFRRVIRNFLVPAYKFDYVTAEGAKC